MNESLTIPSVSIPGRAWDDALNPLASEMQKELGLPEPQSVRRGKGYTVLYRDLSPGMALELADYLMSRGETMISGGDDIEYRHVYRAAIKAGEKMREQVAEVLGLPERQVPLFQLWGGYWRIPGDERKFADAEAAVAAVLEAKA